MKIPVKTLHSFSKTLLSGTLDMVYQIFYIHFCFIKFHIYIYLKRGGDFFSSKPGVYECDSIVVSRSNITLNVKMGLFFLSFSFSALDVLTLLVFPTSSLFYLLSFFLGLSLEIKLNNFFLNLFSCNPSLRT